jgi:hypothetical protein
MTTANRSRARRAALGAVLGALVLALPAPAQAQLNTCNSYGCHTIYCYTIPEGTVCIPLRAGCYGAAPSPGLCNCPFSSGSSCYLIYQTIAEGLPPTDAQLVDEGTDVCHEIIRQRLKVARGVRLFNAESSAASLSGPDRVSVTGTAHPEGVPQSQDENKIVLAPPPGNAAPGRPFTCEVERNSKGEWTSVIVELPKAAR